VQDAIKVYMLRMMQTRISVLGQQNHPWQWQRIFLCFCLEDLNLDSGTLDSDPELDYHRNLIWAIFPLKVTIILMTLIMLLVC